MSGVITLTEKQTIIQLYVEGMIQRKIAKKMNKSRNTVAKYIREFENSRKKDVRNLPFTEEILKPPTYKKRRGKKRVLTEEIKTKLRGYIKDNEWKQQHHMGKQQMKMVDMHEALTNAGHEISYTTVRNFVNQEMAKSKEVFIRRHAEPGHEVEFDWGEVKLDIDGKIKSYSLAVFTLAYSNYRFAKLYPSESQVCVLDAHSTFIEEIGLIPSVFIYDNMRTVVKKFVGTEREITDSMKHLSNYYGFHIRLCNPRKGNEKGHVERSVEFIRRKAFSSLYTFSNLQEAEQHLSTTLQTLNQRVHHEHKEKHIVLLNKEKSVSRPAVSPFDPAELIECRVDTYSTVVIKQNHYSVPEEHVGKYIKAKVGAETIQLFLDGKLVAVHRRNWGVHQWEMDIYHYLETFQKKKGALAQSECLKQAPTQIKKLYTMYYTGKEKEFIELLFYIRKHNHFNRVIKAVQELSLIGPSHVTTEKIIFICEQAEPEKSPSRFRDEIAEQSEHNLKAYAELFQQEDKVVTHCE